MTAEAEVQKIAKPTRPAAWTGSVSATTPPAVTTWRTRFPKMLATTDFAVIAAVVFGTQVFWLGNSSHLSTETSLIPAVPYWAISTLLVIIWVLSLGWADSRSMRIVGFGTTEYIRVADASLRVFGAMAIGAYLLRVELARGFLLMSLPIGLAALILERMLWRKWLMHRRIRGEYCARVLLVGSERSVADTAAELRRQPEAGYRVVGACVPGGTKGAAVPNTRIPVLGDVNSIDQAMRTTTADTVVVTSTDRLPANKVKQISWGLEAGKQHLVIAPSIADIAGPRIHTRPVAGLPLIHVETPRFSRGQLFLKRSVDLVSSVLGVIVLSPVLAGLAIWVKVTSPGTVLFRQKRIGLHGREFEMLKFRSMVTNAEELLEELAAAERDSGNTVMFKMKDDPRVTKAGKFMRRFSLDELPQLFNVIGGSMSLVGPRPPLPSEVEQYADHVHRRFLAKPGITGLWQVSGRSTLSWEETVRLDLSYVENWSMLGDIVILAKTAKAVVAPGDTAH